MITDIGFGIQPEVVFNQSTNFSCVRPYGAEIFDLVQRGDIDGTLGLLAQGNASIHDVDPFGLNLLYVRRSLAHVRMLHHPTDLDNKYAGFYCYRGQGRNISLTMCAVLIRQGTNVEWRDDMGKSAHLLQISAVLPQVLIRLTPAE